MASQNKKNKLKNSHFIKGMLKNKAIKMKGCLFFTASQRQLNNRANHNEQ